MDFFKDTADFIAGSAANVHTHRPFLAIAASVALGLTLGSLWSAEKSHRTRTIASPLQSFQKPLSDKDKQSLVIPLDVLPGARDVSTPYGSIRVYEWGPEDGPKVLLVHGISTPCLSLGGLAHSLVDRGCRVLIFDLFGRGYSDAPADLPQDDRLFTTQILLALTSSPLSWTGASSGQFALVGYSLGGGIAAAFASHFPNLLSSLVLLAPSGLLRDSHISWQSRVLYAKGLIPEGVVSRLVKGRLKAGPLVKPKHSNGTSHDEKIGVEDALTEELTASPRQVLSRAYPSLTTPAAVAWQVENHQGFVPSFISSLRHGPVPQESQLENWKRLGSYLTQRREQKDTDNLPHDKVLIVLGETDNVIVKDDIVEDASAALEGNAQFKYFSIGHEFPSVKYDELAAQLVEFWN
ncbi:putative alpha/beta hydrolase family protein [Talaromyces proteolyticus]|uniref:Alpha/beta hydrolase family protein n=1 Tax=Talaromyces proteolyticus TaxID=1131652 RepID=A0AAD4KVD6_9EURO|nr:putative alpha/beta hydrolase family protein [Talaromyces proteolyticus]KAH8700293.1 putative alpha/beta hydrolase family protein [Talaromyces proteolyticus]